MLLCVDIRKQTDLSRERQNRFKEIAWQAGYIDLGSGSGAICARVFASI